MWSNHGLQIGLTCLWVEVDEYLDILREAVVARNGWKRILDRCSPPRQSRRGVVASCLTVTVSVSFGATLAYGSGQVNVGLRESIRTVTFGQLRPVAVTFHLQMEVCT